MLAGADVLGNSTGRVGGATAAARVPHAPHAPLCLVLEPDSAVRHFLSLILHGAGIDTHECPDVAELRKTLARTRPDLVFINVALDSSAVAAIAALGEARYRGHVQLMSSRGPAVVEPIIVVGQRIKLKLLPTLSKPFDTAEVVKLVRGLNLGLPAETAARIDLEEALKHNWLEFWYQPKIDLRRKTLAGAEAFARVRHPQHGVLPPATFMPGARPAALMSVAQQALLSALRAGAGFAEIGAPIRLTINMTFEALRKLPIADIVNANRPPQPSWPGLIIDVAEDQVSPELALASELATKLAPHKIGIAIDHFGRTQWTVAQLKKVPFVELKLDRRFVADCGTDKINTPICRAAVDLAHGLGTKAAAVGIEKASDAMTLLTMGCDLGQGSLFGQAMAEARFVSLLRQRAAARAS